MCNTRPHPPSHDLRRGLLATCPRCFSPIFFSSASLFEQIEKFISRQSISIHFFSDPSIVGHPLYIPPAKMPSRRSQRLLQELDAETIVVQPQGRQGIAPVVPPAALDSESDDDFIPATYTSTTTIPGASGGTVPSFSLQQPVGQRRAEPSQPPAPGLHTLSPQAIDDMINSAVTRALHRATSAQTLTAPQTESLPRQLLPTILPAAPIPTHTGFTTIAGLRGQQQAAHSAMQFPGMSYGWESGGGAGQFSFPGIPLPPITDPKIISLQALLPEVDPRG